MSDLVMLLTIFVLAIFVGFEVITKVPPTLHTPLMSGSNAISGITIIGALILAGAIDSPEIAKILATVAVVFATDQRGRRLPGHPSHAGDVQRPQEVGARSCFPSTSSTSSISSPRSSSSSTSSGWPTRGPRCAATAPAPSAWCSPSS